MASKNSSKLANADKQRNTVFGLVNTADLVKPGIKSRTFSTIKSEVLNVKQLNIRKEDHNIVVFHNKVMRKRTNSTFPAHFFIQFT